ncbi:MAG: hypothetical protein WA006_03125 [Rhodoglobus sp.]
MELLFVFVIAASIGLALRYLVPQRGTSGALLLPAIAAAAAAIVWVALLWFGWSFDGTWIWVASLAAGGIAALVVGLVLPRRRVEADAHLLSRLSGGKA